MSLIKALYFLFLLCTSISFIATAQKAPNLPGKFDIQGHRGARGLKPENTLPAFETALDLGVTTLELDLHFTLDGVVVVWHDDRIERDKCGLKTDPEVESPDPDKLIFQNDRLLISQLTWEQIQTYRCDRNPDESGFPDQDNSPTSLAGDDYHLLRLSEVFTFVADYAQSELKTEEQRENASHVLFNIETKRKVNESSVIGDNFNGKDPGDFEKEILSLIEEFKLEDRVIIQSFDFRSLWAIHSVNQDITLAALTSRFTPDLTDLATNGAAIWSPNYRDLDEDLIDSAHNLELRVIPWTVNDTAIMQQLIEWGVDGIITDRPDILLGIERGRE